MDEVYADAKLATVRATWELMRKDSDGKVVVGARNRSLDVLRRSADGKWRIFRSVNYPGKAGK